MTQYCLHPEAAWQGTHPGIALDEHTCQLRNLTCQDRAELAPELLRLAVDAHKPGAKSQTAAASGSNVRVQPEWHQDHRELWCPQAHQWGCKACGNAYDLAAIEAQLVRAVRLKARAFQLQDLRCTKCRQVGCPPACQVPLMPACFLGAARYLDRCKHWP